ncbi:hypothetical protein DSM25558_4872 [Agrobacterium sp. DSM 25558]|uniref:hypothetical protein n=1 Tax=Agrobacterium sp. DSM 25558 TaxID=1907665 RepID=UPI0009724B37|nr:hypothetical protein [Agrobacterium sp. DSM 25558]SCX30162.1 hypothetical protein DSM25558_4872 [Agrobacterium sp. DSM 25558]
MAKSSMGLHLRRANPNSQTREQRTGALEENGVLEVVFVDHNAPTKFQRFNFGRHFQHRPEVTRAVAHAFYEIALSQEPATRSGTFTHVATFLDFLAGIANTYGRDVQILKDINLDIPDLFYNWVKGDLTLRSLPRPELASLTWVARYRTVRRLFRIIRNSSFGSQLDPSLAFRKPEGGSHLEVRHRTGMTEAQLVARRHACLKEVDSVLNKLAMGMSYVDEFDIEAIDITSKTVTPFRDFKTCVAAYSVAEQDRLNPGDFAKKYPGLKRALRPPYHRKGDVLRHLHFTPRTLVPFILLLNQESIFNPDGQLLLELDKIALPSTFSPKTRLRSAARKRRGRTKDQIHTYPINDGYRYGTQNLYAEIRQYTMRARALLGTQHLNKLFVFAYEGGGHGSFQSQNRSTLWRKSLAKFNAENGLDHITMSQNRSTGADLVSEISGGDIQAQKEKLNHDSIYTAEQSYESPRSRSRRRELLALEMAFRSRRLDTDGKFDPRGQNLTVLEKSAVTPGFLCLDPYESPWPTETKGRLCGAYGKCPACPLAGISSNGRPKALFRLLQLRARFEEARAYGHADRWDTHWRIQLTALDDEWLPKFSPLDLEDAKQLNLPAIPVVD